MHDRVTTVDLNKTVDLNRTKAYRLLRRLASTPLDLASPKAFPRRRVLKLRSSGPSLTLLFATERITDEVLAALQQLADETRVVDQYAQMLRGARMNRIEGYKSENRPVLHSASRNVFADLACDHDGAQEHAVANTRKQLGKLQTFLGQLEAGAITNARGESFTDLVQVGIGGSDLGPRAVYLALRDHWRPGYRVHFISNVDPQDATQVLAGIDLSRTLINVVSKSGSTLETRTNEALVAAHFVRAGLDPSQHFLCVTGEGSPMDNPERYLRSFYMYDYIGGRFSATSMVGGVALGFGLGYEGFLEILRGARETDLNGLEREVRKNLALLSALIGIWNRNFLGCDSLAIIPYSQALDRFVAHLQQLDMESNGKRINRRGKELKYATGPIVWGEPGTNAQHAFFQLLHQSETIIPCEFIAFRQSQAGLDVEVEDTNSQEKLLANLLAQARALATGRMAGNPNKVFPGNRPSSILIADQLTPHTLGALLAYYENKVAFQGFIWNINSFDQEGVELGKALADRFIGHFAAKRRDPEYSGARTDRVGWAMLEAAGLM